ncbi:O-antigen ligase family protein [Turicibacter sanguinis]|uniref:O-antigen ligase family protein n=1 Tax=Turicibacter sanguinis TaxID=154288 RepID=UPI00189B8533|nr:O-antigen ligase family protein [Turicibacter sanguinis]MDB8555546.1 O-antigen ligase family protein [Turicibacter sanguinis]
MIIKTKDNKSTFLLSAIVLLLLITLGMTSNGVTIVCVIAICIINIISSPTIIVGNLFLFYPFYCLFKFNGAGISYYNIIILVSICSLFCSNYCIYISKKSKTMIGYLFVLLVYINIIALVDVRVDFIKVTLDFFIPFLLVVAVVQNMNYIDVRVIVVCFAFGIITAGMIGAEIIPVTSLNKYVEPAHYKMLGVRLVRLQGLTVNPNYYSLDVNICIAGILVLIGLTRTHKRIFYWCLIVILLIIGFMTLSKSFIVGLLINMLLILVFNQNKTQMFKYFLVNTIGLLVFVYISQNNIYVQAILQRLNVGSSDMETLTSSRSVIWGTYLQYLISNPLRLLLGKGVGAPSLIVNGISHASHNFYLECLYYFGIVGSLLLIKILKCVFQGGNRKVKLVYVPMFVLLARAVAINIILREAFAMLIIFVALLPNVFHNKTIESRDYFNASDRV